MTEACIGWSSIPLWFRGSARHAPNCAAGLTGRATSRAAVDGRATRGQVDDHAPAIERVAALAQRDIADQRDDAPVEIIDDDIAAGTLFALGDDDAAIRIDPLDLDAAGVAIGHGHPRRLQAKARLGDV